jgi:hypothetical protein
MKIRNVVIILLIVIAVLLVGGVYYSGKISPVLQFPPQIGTTTTTTTTNMAPMIPSPVAPAAQTTYFGGTYHNSVYGLTLNLPTDYQPFDTGTSPAGVVGSDSIQFTENGLQVFSINVFTKQQWNTIRTEENTENLDVNDLGEGTYLGENETYIFSYNIVSNQAQVQSILSSIKYY